AELGLSLWAEDSQRAVKSPSQAMRSARPHPFAAPADEINDIQPGSPAVATLLLPSLRTAPLDSPELVRVTPRPPARSAPTLLPWTVPVVTLTPPAALNALTGNGLSENGLTGNGLTENGLTEQVPDGVRCGASVRFLAELARFARELAARGRVLPTVTH